MIFLNPHTAHGLERSRPQKFAIHSNEENFFNLLDHYNTLSDDQKIKYNKLFGYNDLNEMVDITYEENNYEFRSPKIYSFYEMHHSMWVFGDSITYGHGVKYENTWPYLLASDYGLELYNFSVCGRGIDAAIRIAEQWINNSNTIPKLILSYGFYPARYEVGKILSDHHMRPTKIYDVKNLKTDDITVYQSKVDYLNSLFDLYGVKYFNLDFLSEKDGWHNFYEDFARDISDPILEVLLTTDKYNLHPSDEIFKNQTIIPHPGIQSHIKMYQYFQKLIQWTGEE